MTLEEFKVVAEEHAKKAGEKEKLEWEARQALAKRKRTYGQFRDFIKEEGGHWVVVKNNYIVEHCDTKAEAYASLNSNY